MTKAQTIEVRLSECRQKLNELLGVETRSAEQQMELEKLTAEVQKLEPEFRAAVAAEPNTVETVTANGGEGAEYRGILTRASLGRFVHSTVEQRSADGAERELQQHCKLAANEFPTDMLRIAATPETRAAGITTAPTNVATMEDAVIPPVFAMGAGAFLGIDRPTVAAGDAVYPVLSTRPDVAGPHSDSTDAPETAASFAADLLAPERIQASFNYRRTDAARFAGMDMSLRAALNAGLEEKLDYEAIRGTEGLLDGTNLANHAAAAVTTFARYVSDFIYSRVDGRYAATVADVRAVVGSATYAHMGSQYRANNVDDPAAEIIDARTGGVRVSAHVPAVAGNKQNAVIRLGMRRDMVQPMWNNVAIIFDEITGSGKGEIEVTAVALTNVKILRAAGFYKQQTQHA